MKNISFPLQQGNLDYLCSVYAVINLLNAAGKIDTIDEAVEAFETMIAAIDKHPEGSVSASLTAGLHRKDVPWLAKQLDYTLRKISGRKVEDLVEAAQPAAIIHFVGPDKFEHCTVIKGNTNASELKLFDSYGFDHIEYENHAWKIDGKMVEILDLFVLE